MTGRRTKHYCAFQNFKEEAIAGKELSLGSLELLEHIKAFFAQKTKLYTKGTIFYRATNNRRSPMSKADFRPKYGHRSCGRLDNEEQFFLYMAEKKSTCLYEMENTYGKAPMAVATMTTLWDQNLAYIQRLSSFHNYFFPSEENEFYYMIVSAFQQAVANSKPEQYRPTQIMATALLNHGLDGILFRSSKTPLIDGNVPHNVVLFDLTAAEAVSYEVLSLPTHAYSDQDQQSLTQQNHPESDLRISVPNRPVA